MGSAEDSTYSFEELSVSKHEIKGVGHYFGLFAADAGVRPVGAAAVQLNEPGDTAYRADSDAGGERNPQ
ncbi:MAG: hypothetical protein LBU46_01295 [Candidatus Accumulibacter sp.]|jgi:hypothetical protein|nr:hypothetical protein [Accumulibacter sp.]